MQALNRKLARDLWHLRSQMLAVTAVVTCSVGAYVSMRSTYRSLVVSQAAYYRSYRFADVFAGLKRAPASFVARIGSIPGVAAVQTRVVHEVVLDMPGLREPATGRLVSVPARRAPMLNDLFLRHGGYIEPGQRDEIIISEAFAEANKLSVGDALNAVLNGRWERLRIVGIALSPEYVYEVRGGGDIFPDNRHFGVLWMSEEALGPTFNMKNAFNDGREVGMQVCACSRIAADICCQSIGGPRNCKADGPRDVPACRLSDQLGEDPAMEFNAPDIDALRQLYAESPVAKAFFEHSAKRERDQSETKVDRVILLLKREGHEFKRREIIELFRKMQEQGLGQFVEGRHGWPSRFVWNTGMTSVGRAAIGEPQGIESIPPEDEIADTKDPQQATGGGEFAGREALNGLVGDWMDDNDEDAGGDTQPSTEVEVSKLEGLDTTKTVGWGGEYPLDSVFVRTDQRTVGEVVRRIRSNRYDLNPDFQRDFVWKIDKQSRLIESCLMRIPLPVFYVAEAQDGRIIVVDGLQRLTTFWRYLGNQFKLTFPGSEDAPPHKLEGIKFQDLDLKLQERVEDTQLTLYILDPKAPERAKLDIFERVNGGEILTRQQMRNCLHNGRATRWLKEAATSAPFLQATGGSLDYRTMRDREAINRFCAFSILTWREYRSGDMDSFLAEALDRMNTFSPEQLDEIREQFDRSMTLNYSLFKQHAFRKSLAGRPADNRSVLNIALFDVCSVLLSRLDPSRVETQGESVKQAIRGLIRDDAFSHAITYSTNSRRQVEKRFSDAERALAEVPQ